MNKWLVIISFLLSTTVFSQSFEKQKIDSSNIHKTFLDLNYRSQINSSELYFLDDKSVHSSVKPMIQTISISEDKKPLTFTKNWSNKKEKNSYFRANTLFDLTLGVEVNSIIKENYTGGIGVELAYGRNNFFILGHILPYYNAPTFITDSIQTNYDHDLGTNRSLATNLFFRGDVRAAYQANKFFMLSGGYGKNFFGEGYRSLLLSDNAGAHPFFKIETSFSGIKYVNLYNFWKDNTVDPFNKSLDINKFSAIHYLSWNITRDINLSIFETVVWQGKDTLTNRGFDFNYLNPIVFYRPVEYNLGSSDNVLLGANLSYKITDKHNIYGQFVLDEFLLSELKSHSKWWANKYGFQLGYKSNNFIIPNLYFQVELNGVRPFTYSHKSSAHAYGHLNASVTHPIGSNFYEILNIVSYKSKKHRFTNKITFASYGVDTDSTSMGQNIFLSYTLREGNYDHLMMQGLRLNVLNETFIYEYEFWEKVNMRLTAAYNWRMRNTSNGTSHLHSFNIGIKSRIWNTYNDF